MIQHIIVRPLAVEDVVQAAAWYEKQQRGLGEELIDAARSSSRSVEPRTLPRCPPRRRSVARSYGTVPLSNFLLG